MSPLDVQGQSEMDRWEADARRVWGQVEDVSQREMIRPISELSAKLARIVIRKAERSLSKIFSEDERLELSAYVGASLALAQARRGTIDEVVQIARESYRKAEILKPDSE